MLTPFYKLAALLATICVFSQVVASECSLSKADYLVVALSGGPTAERYPVRVLRDVPRDGWSEVYKTSKLVLRRIPARTFTMGSPSREIGREAEHQCVETLHDVSISKEFWIGVFEVTQKQWELVMGWNPSAFDGAMRPVENISYDMIRGGSCGSKWPKNRDVDFSSFLGKLREKTGGVLAQVLEKFYFGKRDEKTLDLLKA